MSELGAFALLSVVAAIPVFWGLSGRAARGDIAAGGWAGGIVVVLTVASLFSFFLSLLLSSLQCDESCSSEPGASWHDTVGAWQWSAQAWLAGVATAAMIVAAVLTARRRHLAARLWLLAGVGLFAAWVLFLML